MKDLSFYYVLLTFIAIKHGLFLQKIKRKRITITNFT